MYDISNPAEPRLASQLWLGGSIAAGGAVSVGPDALASIGLSAQPRRAEVKGVQIQGGPQMLQLRCVLALALGKGWYIRCLKCFKVPWLCC
jgi:hypothetical protein